MRKVYIQKIKNIKEILKEVETSSLNETIANFKKDLFIEREIFAWECIAITYQDYTHSKSSLSLAKKKEIFSVLLGLSAGINTFDHLNLLNSKEINRIKTAYFK